MYEDNDDIYCSGNGKLGLAMVFTFFIAFGGLYTYAMLAFQ